MSPDSTPKYPQILEELRGEIVGGKYPYGTRLPSESALMDRFSASRPTVHRAMVELEDEGLLDIQQGYGATARYVRPLLRPIGKRMAFDVWGAGHSVWEIETEGREYEANLVSRRRGKPIAAAVPYLGDVDVWTREREHVVDGAIVMLSWSCYPAQIVDGSRIAEDDTGPGGAPAVLAGLGHAPHRHSERLRVVRDVPAEQRKRMGLPRGTRAVILVRVSRDAEDRVVEVTEMVANSDAFVFQIDYTS